MRLVLLSYKIEYRFFDRFFQETNGNYFVKNNTLPQDAQKNRKIIEESLEVDFLSLLHQTHSSDVARIETSYALGMEPEADASVTNIPNIALSIITADCIPVLLYCKDSKVIGAAHCGWKGARSPLINNIISEMKKLGASNITAIIGPSILQPSYEISEEFYYDFISENSQNDVFFIPSSKKNKFLFDLPGYVTNKLKNAGVSVIITDYNEDTYSNEEKYHSRRRSFHRNEEYTGTLLSTIVIKPC